MQYLIFIFFLVSIPVQADKYFLKSKICSQDEFCYEKTYENIEDAPEQLFNGYEQACNAFVESARSSLSRYAQVNIGVVNPVTGVAGYRAFNSGDYSVSLTEFNNNTLQCVVSFDSTKNEICYDQNSPYFGQKSLVRINIPDSNNSYTSNLTASVFSHSYFYQSGQRYFYDEVFGMSSEYQGNGNAHYNTYSLSDSSCSNSFISLHNVGGSQVLNCGNYASDEECTSVYISTRSSSYIIRIPDECDTEQYFDAAKSRCVCSDGRPVDPVLGCDYSRTCPDGFELNALTGFCVNSQRWSCQNEENINRPDCIDIGEVEGNDQNPQSPVSIPNTSEPLPGTCSTSLSCYDSCFGENSFCDVSDHGRLNDGSYFRWYNPISEKWENAQNLAKICRTLMATGYDVNWKPAPTFGSFSKALLDPEYRLWCYYLDLAATEDEPCIENCDVNNGSSEWKGGDFVNPPFIIDYLYDSSDRNKDRTDWNDQETPGVPSDNGSGDGSDGGSGDGSGSDSSSFWNAPDFSVTTNSLVSRLNAIPVIAEVKSLSDLQVSPNACPTYSFEYFGVEFNFDQHCVFLDQIKGVISIFFKAAWTYLAFIIFFRRS